MTVNRRESQGEVQRSIARAVRRLADRGDVEVVLPLHLLPAVRRAVLPELDGHPRVRLCEPLPYAEMVGLLARAELLLTDSGGLQEEVPAFHLPVLVLRETTERPEGVKAGCAVVCGTDPERILQEANCLLDDPARRARMAAAPNPYGDGRAAERIATVVGRELAQRRCPLRRSAAVG